MARERNNDSYSRVRVSGDEIQPVLYLILLHCFIQTAPGGQIGVSMFTVVVYTAETCSATGAAENIPNHHLSHNTANKDVDTEMQSASLTGANNCVLGSVFLYY